MFAAQHGQGIAEAKWGHRHIDRNHVVILVRPVLAWNSQGQLDCGSENGSPQNGMWIQKYEKKYYCRK